MSIINYQLFMVIIGINAYHADASAAVFVHGALVAATEEERFTRVKHWAGFPAQAIAFCLREAGVGYEAVDVFAIGRDPHAKFFKKLQYLARNPSGSLAAVKERLANRRKVVSLAAELAAASGLPEAHFQSRIQHIEHHRSHLASAFFASPYPEAACLSIDGSGDFSTTMTGIGKGKQIGVLQSVDFPHSIGIFYTAFTQLLGFPHYGDEYKVMGMAPYGQPRYLEALRKMVHLTKNGLFTLELSYFRKGSSGIIHYDERHVPVVAPLYSALMTETFGPARKAGEPLLQQHYDLAASVQRMTEETLFHILNHLQQQTGLERVCIAGGVAQNSVANGKITRHTGFREVYIPSAGHDAGIAMGAALYVQHQVQGQERQTILNAYTGSRSGVEEIRGLLKKEGLAYQQPGDAALYDLVSQCLVNGGVVGWMNGRAEFGPRALGARSILADPRRSDAKELLNSKIKRRESFRPFAPSILEEYVAEYFEVDEPVPFMEKVFPIRKEKQALIPAVTHVDGTGRLQTVSKATAPRYYALIEAFRQKTGIPILLNTSFNENEPIVNTAAEALACYLRTDMDMLVMENFILQKQTMP